MFKIEQRAAPFVGLHGVNERVRQLGGELKLSSSDMGINVGAVYPQRGLRQDFHSIRILKIE
jgi:signal transduction histidine kinase